MTREDIIRKFQDLNVWKRDGERAPHKPLLVLYAIGKLLRGEDRLIPYVDDIEENLEDLLRTFGPRRDHYNPQFPFWRLQNDDIWEVSDAANIRQTASGDAYITDLRNYNVSGGFNPNISEYLQNDSALTTEVIQSLLDGHFPASLHLDILRAVEIELPLLTVDTRGWDFWEDVLRAYEYRCAVCGFDLQLRHQPIAMEAAHIKWPQAGGPDSVENGLALCSLHHKLFDRGVFTLSEQLEVRVSEYAHGSVGLEEWLMAFHNREIRLPQRQAYYPNQDFTGWHIKEVFKGPYREIT